MATGGVGKRETCRTAPRSKTTCGGAVDLGFKNRMNHLVGRELVNQCWVGACFGVTSNGGDAGGIGNSGLH